ncbi:RraA family protein [Halorubrum sp. F4]|uniref:RraA family protein n=1 Tax=Halorubrum sp. F4 TaxID=2989715 RepID=UPI002480D3D6|nr:dimethylmenaquinone methyltransferase [Halorubrum sp. F4]
MITFIMVGTKGHTPMIVEDFERPSDEQLDALREINPNDLGHHVHFGHTSPQIKFMETSDSANIVGPALTVRIPPEDGTMVHKATELAKPGDVIVIDMGGHTTNAPWGDVTTHAAMARGVEAVVIDGAVTDTHGIRKLGFPVFARAKSTRTVRGLGIGGDINVPIQAGSTTVEPGDVAIANEEGVLFVPQDDIDRALEHCEGKLERQEEIIAQLEDGASLADLSGANDRIQRMSEE